jgi:predicted phage replisome organizer
MADVKWIKIATEVFDNRKIKQIEKMPDGDSIIVIWFKLLCLAGNINSGGMVYFTPEMPYTEEMLATEFNIPMQKLQTLKLALITFQNFNMIEIVDNVYYISSWEKYQNIEGLEKIREQNRIRKQKERERKSIECHVTVTQEVTQSHATDIDIEIDKEKDIKINKKNGRFTPPTPEEIKAYCSERHNSVDAIKLFDFYTANGWVQGKGKPIKDWKACVRTWEGNDKKPQDKPKLTNNKQLQYPQRAYTAEDYANLEKKLINKGL